MATSYKDLLSSREPMLRPPTYFDQLFSSPDSKNSSSRAGKTTKEIPYSLFDRIVQFVADRANMGNTYKLYCLSSNLELLCKKPEEWKKDPVKAKVLACLLEECKDLSGFEAVLKKTLAPISESSLSQGFAISKEMSENPDLALLEEGSKSSGAYKLKMAFARQFIENATRGSFAFFKSSKADEGLMLHYLACNLLDFMKECPDIAGDKDIEGELNKALTGQFELVLAPASKCPLSQRCNNPKNSVNKSTSDTNSQTAGMAIDSKSAVGQVEERYAQLQLEKVAALLKKAKEAALGELNRKRTRDAGPIDSGQVNSLESGESCFSTRELKRELQTCFKGYYGAIRLERFESQGAEKAIRGLYQKLAEIEDGLRKNPSKHMDVLIAEIRRHVMANDTGREGSLLGKVAIGKKGYTANNGEIKKFEEFKSVQAVLSGAQEATTLSKEKRTVKTS